MKAASTLPVWARPHFGQSAQNIKENKRRHVRKSAGIACSEEMLTAVLLSRSAAQALRNGAGREILLCPRKNSQDQGALIRQNLSGSLLIYIAVANVDVILYANTIFSTISWISGLPRQIIQVPSVRSESPREYLTQMSQEDHLGSVSEKDDLTSEQQELIELCKKTNRLSGERHIKTSGADLSVKNTP